RIHVGAMIQQELHKLQVATFCSQRNWPGMSIRFRFGPVSNQDLGHLQVPHHASPEKGSPSLLVLPVWIRTSVEEILQIVQISIFRGKYKIPGCWFTE